MTWNQRFAKSTGLMRRTAVRELLKLTSQPGIISFAGGLPSADLFPMDQVREATATVLDSVGAQSLQYAETEGVGALRDWLAQRFSRSIHQLSRQNILITSGAQQALDLIGRVFLDEGDPVLLENPTYLALLSAWRPLGTRFLPIRSDAQGMCVEEIEEYLGEKPKLAYLVPNFQNPQGTTLSLERRNRLVALLHERDLVVVEDNPYGDIRFENQPLPDLLELDLASNGGDSGQGRVIHVGTFSKILMPGLRVGWVVAPPAVIEKLVQAKQAADLHTNTLGQHLALELVRSGLLHHHLPMLRRAYRQRRDAMLAALRKHFPADSSWTSPEGGLFLMLTLPMDLNSRLLLPEAIENGVAFVPGEEFHLDGAGANTLRLNFSCPDPAQIDEGIARLARVALAPC